MKKNYLRLMAALLMTMFANVANAENAYDFGAVNADGDSIWYNIVSQEDKTCEVTYRYTAEMEDCETGETFYVADDEDSLRYIGTLNIPSEAVYNGTTYTVVGIGQHAFFNCNKLEKLIMAPTITYIDSMGVINCISLKSVEFSSSLKEIRSDAFDEDSLLSDIVLPNSLERIEEWAFLDCASIKSLNIPASVNYISDGSVIMGCTSLSSLTVDSENPYYFAMDNIIFTKDTTKVVAYAAGAPAESVILPETVDTIEHEAFYGVQNLKKIVLPANLKHIGFYSITCDTNHLIDTIVCKRPDPIVGKKDPYADLADDEYPTVFYMDEYAFMYENEGDSTIYNNTILVVPDGSKEAYQTTYPWSLFKNIMTESEVSGIKSINAGSKNSAADEKVFDLQGRRLNANPENGVYIKGRKKYSGYMK